MCRNTSFAQIFPSVGYFPCILSQMWNIAYIEFKWVFENSGYPNTNTDFTIVAMETIFSVARQMAKD